MRRRLRLPRLPIALAGVALLALAVRGFVAVPRSVPSESMMPTLLPGDLFLAVRWPYGSAVAGRFGSPPRRGDIVIVGGHDGDVVKRVIGLPGDRIALRKGVVIVNGRGLPRYRVADFLVTESASSPCPPEDASRRERQADGGIRCRIARWHESLPGGRGWDILDRGTTTGDDFAEATVPRRHLFLLGDNRDRSADSRVDPAHGGLGFVDFAALRGRAIVLLWSIDRDRTGAGRGPLSVFRTGRTLRPLGH